MKSTNGNRFLPSLFFLPAFLIAAFILVVQKEVPQAQKEFALNEPAPRTVFSPTHLTFENEEETARERAEKVSQVLPVYTVDPKIKKTISARIEEILKDPLTKSEGAEGLLKALTLLAGRFFNDGVLEDSEKKKLFDSGKTRILVTDPEKKTEERSVKDLLSVSEIQQKASGFLGEEGIKDRALRSAALEIFNPLVRPNLFFDEAESRARLKQAFDSAAPVMEELKTGEMVIQKGYLVTAKEQKRLIQIQKKLAEKETQNRLVTVGLLVFLGLGLLFLYLRQFEPKQIYSPRFLLLVLASFLVTLVVERILLLFPGASPYLLPGAVASVLLTVFWGPSLGMAGALSISIFSVSLAEFRLEIFSMMLLGSLVAAFAAQKIRKRIHFFKIGIAVGLVNTAVLMAFFPFQEGGSLDLPSLGTFGFANGFLVTVLSLFLILLFEHLFNLTTDITLLELSDLNHPLLKRMVVEAPGTYHHSLVVSTLAEAACEVIGANALLARVGCYFHDIGKIAHSEYFTENQTPQTGNQHEKLTPTTSCLMIMNHVKDGVELAKKYKLKEVIIRFIPEHQGKGVVYYFYKKALDQAAPGESVRADDFRYPGPKPQSRETAVALLADSVEAASRSLTSKELTPEGIRMLVRKIINEKFIDGQLDECDLTLKDLHKIQESFVHNLMAIFHTRVGYPPLPTDPRRPDIFEADQFKKFH